MIGFLQGRLQQVQPQRVVLLAGDVGYELQLPLSDMARVGEVGKQVQLHIHTHVREDAIVLYGFLQYESLQAFRVLIQVNGVGPRVALAVLSALTATQLHEAVVSQDAHALLQVPGIGKKTAQRLVLELRDRLGVVGMSTDVSLPVTARGILGDLRSAIANLGYRPHQVDAAVAAVKDLAQGGQSLDVLLPKALQHLAGKQPGC
ncbi:MAG: Holliday junction branch migration protein RuvA [Myxococcota bacterium]